jgi:hypothetical protein
MFGALCKVHGTKCCGFLHRPVVLKRENYFKEVNKKFWKELTTFSF